MIIWTVREIDKKSRSQWFTDYLEKTRNVGEPGALEYLAQVYRTKFKKASILDGLSSDPRKIYETIFEITLSLPEENKLLENLQNDVLGAEFRDLAHQRIFEALRNELNSNEDPLESSEVLLDVPLRNIGLGGNIFVRGYDGKIKHATGDSDIIALLSSEIAAFSKVLRVFIAPKRLEKIDDLSEFKRNLRPKIILALHQKEEDQKNSSEIK